MPSRRRVLLTTGVAFAGLFAGCVEPGGALEMVPVPTDEGVGREATRPIDETRDPDLAALVADALENDGTSVEGERPPFRPDRPIAFGGGVYGVEWTVEDERTESGYLVSAVVGDVDDEDRGAEVGFEDLPAVDQKALADLPDLVAEYRRDDHPADQPLGTDGTFTHEDDREDSVLVPDQEYEVIVVDGEPVALEIRPHERVVETYRYDLAVLGESLADYGATLREREFALEGLTDDERELVEEAIENGQAVVGRDDGAFVGVGERLLEHEPIYEDDYTGEWLVSYEGASYWTILDALRTQELVDRLGGDGN
ncbi:hypothetical protein [Natrarchaeobaculum aegyptiacum]|uniref:Uncharacterized protein n=1 Tax=Natrarchaeobaculum aegyptiacum TaxID=745377 RepID=A0A2Z2HPE6_9EURY|nr:hypothetical protein [Natrarchaeobaculum aegyptiacum]ARS88890.1 hypothetical protein B1756_03395 [Natrarchaeobaculum aegyptiacum]